MPDFVLQTREHMYSIADDGYRAFQSSLLPGIPRDSVIGVRTPALRHIAKDMTKNGSASRWLAEAPLPHPTYEENNLHAYLIEGIRDFDVCLSELNRFLPYVDNWATCDTMNPPVLITRPDALWNEVCRWLADDRIYTVRYGLGMLLRYWLGARFSPEVLSIAAAVSENTAVADEYYVRMMQAWFFAEALAGQPDAALPYLTGRYLPVWVHNKTIQKARESRKIPAETKAFLGTLKLREGY
ncbi:MAG: DNA alkylation repair protein [Clostridia bacterium]|nr:DNA alkylation repair protein [Clostridia bacterium]